MQDLLVGSPPVEVGNKHGGVTKVWADIHPGDGDERALQRSLPADEAGEDAAN